MKKFTLFLLLLIGSFAYSQAGTIYIFNFSTQNIQFRINGNNTNLQPQDCQPVLYHTNMLTLTSGSVVDYPQYNTSYLKIPAINSWYVVSDIVGIPTQTYNVNAGQVIPPGATNPTNWSDITITTPAGEYYQLGRSCTGPNIDYATPTGGSIFATWQVVGNDIYVTIT